MFDHGTTITNPCRLVEVLDLLLDPVDLLQDPVDLFQDPVDLLLLLLLDQRQDLVVDNLVAETLVGDDAGGVAVEHHLIHP